MFLISMRKAYTVTYELNVAHLVDRANAREAAVPHVLSWLLDRLPEHYWSTKSDYAGLGRRGVYRFTLIADVTINCGAEGDVTLHVGDEISIFCDPRHRGRVQIAAIFCRKAAGRDEYQLCVRATKVVRKEMSGQAGRRSRRNASAGAMTLA